MEKEVYEVIANEEEIKWFFDHVVEKPKINESYSAVFVCRHKKLTKDEMAELGLTRREAEFLSTQTFRLARFHDALKINDKENWTFDKFLRKLKCFEVNKDAYTTSTGAHLPNKTLATIFYVNPGDDMKVCQELFRQYGEVNNAIAKAMLNGKTTLDNLQSYQWFTNMESNIKHLKANQKGSKYWMDFDVDVPAWFRYTDVEETWTVRSNDPSGVTTRAMTVQIEGKSEYYKQMIEKLTARFGKGNYVIVSTGGGYHILVRISAIKSNPNDFCKEVEEIYKQGLADGNPEYLDENGVCKFEAIVNDSQIPGLPLPGTYQYGRPVVILNKEDFE